MSQASHIIQKFGGIRPAAAILGMPHPTVQGWVKRGWIPSKHHAYILAVSKAKRKGVKQSDFFQP